LASPGAVRLQTADAEVPGSPLRVNRGSWHSPAVSRPGTGAGCARGRRDRRRWRVSSRHGHDGHVCHGSRLAGRARRLPWEAAREDQPGLWASAALPARGGQRVGAEPRGSSPRLRRRFDGCRRTGTCGGAPAPVLGVNPALAELDLAGNTELRDGGMQPLCEGLRRGRCRLQTLR